MPKPKTVFKKMDIGFTKESFEKIAGLPEGNSFAEKLNIYIMTSKQPEETATHDIEHLNIHQKDGAVQTYLRKREGRLEQRKERMEEAREKAEIKVETARKIAEIRKETENREQFQKRYIQKGKPKVDWGNSQGAEPNWHEGYR